MSRAQEVVWSAATLGVTCLLLASCGPALAGETAPSAGPADVRGEMSRATNEISLGQAVLMALTRNRAMAVQRLTPAIRKTFEQQERAVFDPVLSGDLFTERTHATPAAGSLDEPDAATANGGTLALGGRLPTGTRLAVEVAAERADAKGTPATYAGRTTFSVTQALLQGRPIAVNLAALRQSRLDTAMAEYEFRGFIEALAADVETAYWECALAERRVEILEESLRLADQQLNEVAHRIRVGDLPETELASAQAQTALRREALINARSALAIARLRLLRLTDPDALAAMPRRELALTTRPAAPEAALDTMDSHVAAALRWRPDLNQARLGVARNDLDIVKTRNGLLPKMDLFITLGQTGYAASFKDSFGEIDGQDLDVSAGVSLEFPPANREARARHRRALLTREQVSQAMDNLVDLARVDVESAYIDVDRTREQIAATATTRKFQEEKVRAETAKFRVGKSTALLVAQAQQDLVASQVSEVESLVRNLQALVTLFRSEGSLLQRRGLSVPDPEARDGGP